MVLQRGRGPGSSGLGPFACPRRVSFRRRTEDSRLNTDNEVCFAWLEDALRQLRAEGQTKVAGYLQAVLEEAKFEAKVLPRS